MPFHRRLLGSQPFAPWHVTLAAAALGLGACNGCRSGTGPASTGAAAPTASAVSGAVAATPTIRIYVATNVAGALEPCGCTRDQLGGVDHFAAFVASEKEHAPNYLVVGAGPTLFQDPKLDEARATQAKWKAEALAASLVDTGLVAWTPGFNDWAGGDDFLTHVVGETSSAAIVAGNLRASIKGKPLFVATETRDVSGLRIGIVGVSDPSEDGARPPGLGVEPFADAMRAGVAELEAKGVKLLIGLASLPRRDAMRLAEQNPSLDLLVVGKAFDAGEANDDGSPPALVGSTLVVQAPNHLQSVGVVDFFQRNDDGTFRDGSGIANAEAVESKGKRIREIENRLGQWEKDPAVSPEDLAARRKELTRLQSEKVDLEKPIALPEGSYFRYRSVPIRGALGVDAKVADRMRAYYRRVNDHNKEAFAGRKPPPVPKGASSYIGVEACTKCHAAPRKVWDATPHARAYATLSTQFKEFNLDCVSCHVTGYEKPGGSTVTSNDLLQNVGCEECHGPGSAHAKNPKDKGLIQRFPDPQMCVNSCHHPPHVEGFDPLLARAKILGPGHGLPAPVTGP